MTGDRIAHGPRRLTSPGDESLLNNGCVGSDSHSQNLQQCRVKHTLQDLWLPFVCVFTLLAAPLVTSVMVWQP